MLTNAIQMLIIVMRTQTVTIMMVVLLVYVSLVTVEVDHHVMILTNARLQTVVI